MNKFDQHIKNKLTQHQAPPLEAWKNIEDKLDEKEKKRFFPFIFWISSSAACIGIIGLIYFINTNQSETKNVNLVKEKTTQKTSGKSVLKSNKIDQEKANLMDTNNVINIVSNNDYNYYSSSYNQSQIQKNTNKSVLEVDSIENNKFNLIENNVDDKSISTPFQQSENDISNTNLLTLKDKETEQNQVEEKSIEDILKENEVVKIEPKNIDAKMKFEVSTFVSPTKFFKDESILSNSFNTHEIDNKISIAYGAKLAYQLNDKLKIRTGISKLDFEQSTNDIVTARVSTYQSSTIEPLSTNVKRNNNINYIGNTQVIPNHNAYPISYYETEENTMNQQVEFIEIPVEVEYKIIKKSRFNFSVIGGGSYIILAKNDIYINNNSFGRSKIGKADNLNNISYSANASLKLEYLLSNKAGINLEPNYKFLINPLKDFSNKDNSLLGIGLGFSYKF